MTDVIVAPLGGNGPGADHPAMFPVGLAGRLIRTLGREGDPVPDPL